MNFPMILEAVVCNRSVRRIGFLSPWLVGGRLLPAPHHLPSVAVCILISSYEDTSLPG